MLASILLACSPALLPQPAQGRLFMLGRLGKISEIHYDTPQGGSTEVVSYLGGNTFPSGLEVDRSTGEFLVLIPDWAQLDGNSEILRVDPITGQTNAVHVIPGNLYGLEQGIDGEYFSSTIRGGLVRIDLESDTSETLLYDSTDPSGGAVFYSGLAMRPDGRLEGVKSQRWTIHPGTGEVELFDWSVAFPTSTLNVNSISYEIGPDGTRYLVAPNEGMIVVDPNLSTGTLRDDLVNIQYIFGLCFDSSTHNAGIQTVCEGNANSLGLGATLEFVGTPEIATNSLELFSRRLPLSSFGYFITGPNTGSTTVGSGVLCISTPVSRYSQFPLNSGTSGSVLFNIDLLSIPSGGAAAVGRTDVFQYWFRDQGGTSNLSDAVAVTMR